VTVLERDPAPVPDSLEDAWERWERSGVSQFRQAHYLQPLGRVVLDEELPDVRDALLAAGAGRFDALQMMPPWIADRSPRPGDERFLTITARRPALEHTFARVAEEALDVRRGVAVAALLGGPRVTGIRTETGEELPADLVVDAMGRRSRVPQWFAGDGIYEESEDSGFLYYTRFFRGAMPRLRGSVNVQVGTISILTLPGDGDTWSVTLNASAGDRPLKRLRDADVWTAVVAACPLQAQWLDGEPTTGVLPMGGVVDRYRRLPAEVTGLALLADAFACTNPSLGRGIALGLRHAQVLRDCAREEDPRRFADAWSNATERELTPWYRATVAIDRHRLREVEALRNGHPQARPADRAATVQEALMPAALQDPDMFRTMLAHRCCLGPADALEEPELGERILALAADAAPLPVPGPDRERLLALVR
jgi:2-polyprenyl-6-methoxyphenol hydroxylase-like FAD-dependent oxidoreductase